MKGRLHVSLQYAKAFNKICCTLTTWLLQNTSSPHTPFLASPKMQMNERMDEKKKERRKGQKEGRKKYYNKCKFVSFTRINKLRPQEASREVFLQREQQSVYA